MPIILVTGKNGHGKGQFIIREILRIQKENDKREKEGKPRRQIFANIHGVNEPPNTPLPDVQPLPENPKIFFGKQDNPDDPPPDDCFVPPLGSVFIYDECQKIDWIKQKSGALSNDIRVRSLEEHRHAGHDIYLITQSPNYIHSHLFDLASPHFYVERALNLPQSNVFRFNSAQKTPSSSAIKAKADDQFFITLGKEYGQYYKSVGADAEHNMKTQLPVKLKVGVAILFCLVLWTANSWYKAGWIGGKKEQGEELPQPASAVEQVSETPQSTQPQNQQHRDLTKEQLELKLKAQEVEFLRQLQAQEIQSRMQFEQLQKQYKEQQKQIQDFEARLALYAKNLPKNYEVIKQNLDLQVRAVVKMKDKCQAYNTHGDLMTLTFDECDYYLQASGRVHKTNGTTANLKVPSVAQTLTDNPNFGQVQPQTQAPSPENKL